MLVVRVVNIEVTTNRLDMEVGILRVVAMEDSILTK